MPPATCPTCQATLPEKELEAGWCESCGKRIPDFVRGDRGRAVPNQAAPRPPSASGGRSRMMRIVDALPHWWVLVIGFVLAAVGAAEYRVSLGTSAEPTDVDFAALEEGAEPPQNHVRLGRHFRIYPGLVYQMKERDQQLGDPPIDFALYPILSPSNSLLADVMDPDKLDRPTDMRLPDIGQVRVLVLTKKYKKLSQVPTRVETRDSITGLLVNRIRGLEKEEQNLLRKSYPDIDFERTLILEEDRKPQALLLSALLAAGGGVLVLLAAVGLFRRVFVKPAS